MWSLKTIGLLAQVSYSEKCTFLWGGGVVVGGGGVGGLKGWSLNTGGHKDRFHLIYGNLPSDKVPGLIVNV